MDVGGNLGLSGQTPPTRPPGRRKACWALVCSISLAFRPGQAERSAALTCVHVWVAKAAARPMPKKTRHQCAATTAGSGEAAEVWSAAQGQHPHPGSRFKPLKAICRRRAGRCSSWQLWNLQQSKRVEVEQKIGLSQQQHYLTVTDYLCS